MTYAEWQAYQKRIMNILWTRTSELAFLGTHLESRVASLEDKIFSLELVSGKHVSRETEEVDGDTTIF